MALPSYASPVQRTYYYFYLFLYQDVRQSQNKIPPIQRHIMIIKVQLLMNTLIKKIPMIL